MGESSPLSTPPPKKNKCQKVKESVSQRVHTLDLLLSVFVCVSLMALLRDLRYTKNFKKNQHPKTPVQ